MCVCVCDGVCYGVCMFVCLYVLFCVFVRAYETHFVGLYHETYVKRVLLKLGRYDGCYVYRIVVKLHKNRGIDSVASIKQPPTIRAY